MQVTQPWHRCHLVTDAGSFLCRRKMRSVLGIVADVFVHQAFQMPLIENDHVVERIPAAGAYPAFRNTVPPWTSEARPLWPDTEALYGFGQFAVDARCASSEIFREHVKDQLAQFLADAFCPPQTGAARARSNPA